MYDMNANEVISMLLDRLTTEASSLGRVEQRSLDLDAKSWAKDDEIRSLKAKLAKYEATPGYPMPLPIKIDSTAVAVKIGEAMRFAKNGEKIASIKLVREISGCGLKEAKDAVEMAYPPSDTIAPRW
jgi:hypothetical protein